MNRKIPLGQRLRRLFLGETQRLSFTLGLLSILLGLGFFLASSQTENYVLINSHAGQAMWGILYGGYGVLRVFTSIYRVKNTFKLFLTFSGLVLWLLLFLSFTVFDTTALRPTEVMLGIPILIEFWLAISAIDCIKSKRYGRADDDK